MRPCFEVREKVVIRKILALVISLPILVLAVLVLSLVAEADDGAMNSIES